jgi:hypothetical protein
MHASPRRAQPNADADIDDVGHKWSLAALYRVLGEERGLDTGRLSQQIDAILAKTLIAATPHVSVRARARCVTHVASRVA